MDQLKKQLKIVDMMLTMHSAERDRFLMYRRYLDFVNIVASTILCATVFLDPAMLIFLGIDAGKAKLIIGISSIIIFILNLYLWKNVLLKSAEQHNQAAHILARIKGEIWAKFASTNATHTDFMEEYCRVQEEMNNLPVSIEESRFLALKRRHYFKVCVSKAISAAPSCPVLIIKMVLIFRGTLRVINKKHEEIL